MLERALYYLSAAALSAGCVQQATEAVDAVGESHAALTSTTDLGNGCQAIAFGHDTGANAGVPSDGILQPGEIESMHQVCTDAGVADPGIYAPDPCSHSSTSSSATLSSCPPAGGPFPGVYDANGAYLGVLLDSHPFNISAWKSPDIDVDFMPGENTNPFAPGFAPNTDSDSPEMPRAVLTLRSSHGFIYRIDSFGRGGAGRFAFTDRACSVVSIVQILPTTPMPPTIVFFASSATATTYFVPDGVAIGSLPAQQVTGFVLSNDRTSCSQDARAAGRSGRLYEAAAVGLPAQIQPPFVFSFSSSPPR
ncbi:MAG TPA: hypothetical protein VM925_08990 [Labilithrix sp.]|nr:hypothetical protein [Labilithrix sp.]